jgi:hypothetical protein
LIEQTVDLGVEAAFSKVKATLVDGGCTVMREQAGKTLVFKQGSLMGIAPKTAKKTIRVDFEALEDKTKLVYASAVASDWKYVTLIGCILAVALAAVCLWMTLDLEAFMATGQSGIWGWLITAQDKINFQVGKAFVDLAYGLAAFLFVVVAVEAVIYVNVQAKINGFAKENLSGLS